MNSLSDGPDGSPKVETHFWEFRFTLNECDDENSTSPSEKTWLSAIQFWEKFNKRFNVKYYLWSFERSDDGVPHIHGMVDFGLSYHAPKKSTLSDWVGNQSENKKGRSMWEHKPVVDQLRYGAYILKDGSYRSNMKEEDINNMLDKMNMVKKDMKLMHQEYLSSLAVVPIILRY